MRYETINALQVVENDILLYEGYRVRATDVAVENHPETGKPVARFTLHSEPDLSHSHRLPRGFEGMNSGGNERALYGRECGPLRFPMALPKPNAAVCRAFWDDVKSDPSYR